MSIHKHACMHCTGISKIDASTSVLCRYDLTVMSTVMVDSQILFSNLKVCRYMNMHACIDISKIDALGGTPRCCVDMTSW